MGYDEIRVYGGVTGVGQGAAVLEDEFGFTEFELAGDELTIEYEGAHFFIEEFIEQLEPFLTPQCAGRVDYIDHHEWTLTRYKFAGGAATRTKVGLNDVLDRYNHP